MAKALILTAPQAMTSPLSNTPKLRVAGDVFTLTSDTFTGGDVSTLLDRKTDARLGGASLKYECLDPASWAISNGALAKGPSVRTNSTALVKLPAERSKDVTMSVRITAAPVQTQLAGPAMYLVLCRDEMPQPKSQLRVGLYYVGTTLTYALFTMTGGSQTYIPSTVKTFAVGDTLSIRHYNGLVQISRNGALEVSYEAGPTFNGDWFGFNTVDPQSFGFDDFKITETVR